MDVAELKTLTDGSVPSLPEVAIVDLLVRADRAQLTQSVARGLTHTLANALQVLNYRKDPALVPAIGDLGLAAARRVLMGIARPGESIVGPVLVGDVLAEVDDWQRCQTGLPPVPLTVSVVPALPAARVCGTHLRHALLDLITNAKEAVAGRRDAEIRLSARAEADGITITVEDDGPGIPAGDLERVFDAFFTTRDAALHFGLGLTVARRLIEADGGTLRAVAPEGPAGARFVARLPAWSANGRDAG